MKLLKLNGIIEAAINHCMEDEKWMSDMAADSGGGVFELPNTVEEVFQALESFVTDVLAAREVEVVRVDNRDERTTWLWINEQMYVEVDPVDLYENMKENCPEFGRE